MSDLARKLIQKEKQIRSGILDLGNCGLTTLPDALFDCTWLETLYLCNSYWDDEKQAWIHSPNEGEPNRLSALPPKMAQLKSLKVLYANAELDERWDISDISILKHLTQLHTLDLRQNQISDISSLQHLTQLHTLGLSGNQISNISILKHLTQLHTLDLSANQISAISILKHLTQLHTLHLSRNEISDISILKHLTQLHTLHLSGNEISAISSLQHLTQLHTLDLGANPISAISSLQHLTQLHTLNLHNNQISAISILKHLTKLHTLDLSVNKISAISSLQHLTQLHTLNLHNNQISAISILKHLTQLHTLDLGANPISDFSVLQHLHQLHTLYLNYNKISDLSSLQHLPPLHTLDLSVNKISAISSLQHLTQLHTLYLRQNQISDISSLQHLTQLHTLDLRSNQISDISSLQHLTQLHTLYLSSNKILDISSLQHLTQLHTLYLSSNKISAISSLQHLTQLHTSDLQHNQISDISPLLPLIEKGIPISLEPFDKNKEINLFINPITHPPLEIVEQGNQAILNYFEALKKGGEVALYEAKLLIIGEGGAGKTSLTGRIKDANAPMPEASTEGIDIVPYEFTTSDGNAFRVNIWDFGGQEIYHATHQFFLTKRSLYILLDDTLKDDKTAGDPTFDYWLQVVELLSENSPVLIVQNEKSDRKKELDMPSIKGRFPNVMEDIATNILTCRNLDTVRAALQYHVQQLPHVKNKLPKQWVDIRTELEQMASIKSYISLEDYLELCAKHDIAEEEKALLLSSYLHDLGAFLHFQDNLVLRDFFILRNDWATDAVYKVLDNQKVKVQVGYFTKTDLEFIWQDKQYRHKHLQLLALMEKFQLCFALKDRNEPTWLAPQLLPIETPNYEWSQKDNLLLRYRYGFMPKGLLSSFIVRMNRYVQLLEKAWRSGVFLERENTDALVRETYGSREIVIAVRGAHPKELMTLIAEELDKINESYGSKLVVKKLIPCNCKTCKPSETPYFYDYNNLKRRKERGRTTIECEISYEDVPVQDLLDGVFSNVVPKTALDLAAPSLKIIELFLASSNELKAERDAIEIWIRRENDRLATKGIYLKLNLWEDFISAMSQTRKQDDYNKVVLSSSIFISLFATKVGQYTREEFETAYQNFKAGGATQYIYTYFKNAQINTNNMNLEELSKLDQFKKYLGAEGHFYDTFDTKEHLLLQLKTQLDKLLDKG